LDVNEKENLQRILRKEVALHPRMELVDLQKLVYQAVFGIDHLLDDRVCFANELSREWKALDPLAGAEEEILQVIDPAKQRGRIHLRACKARGGKIDELTRLLIDQEPAGGTEERFALLWSLAGELAQEEAIPFSKESLAALPFPETPPHHSSGYGNVSYRVVNDLNAPEVVAFLRENLGQS
jgi:hypothetical protein